MRKSANKVAREVRDIIDDFWANRLSKEQAQEKLHVYMDDPELHLKIQRAEEYTGVFKNVMGIRRLNEFKRLLSEEQE